MKSLALFLTHGMSLESWRTGGWLRRELALYEEHARNGVRTTLVSYGGEDDLRIARDFPILTVLTNKWRLPDKVYASLLPYLHFRALQGVDLIKTNQLLGAKQAVKAAKLLHVPAVVRQGYNFVEFQEWSSGKGSTRFAQAISYERQCLSQADLCQHTTEVAKSDCVRRLGADCKTHAVVPNYVANEFWEPPFNHFRELNDVDTFRLGFWGRLAEQKNLELLITACAGLQVELIIAGDGPKRKDIEQQAEKMNVEIALLGQVPHENLASLMAKCDAFILASHLEGHPKSLIEAMFFGMPVIAADSPGIRPIVVDGQTALIAKNSVASVRSTVQRARRLSASERRRIAGNAREFAHKNYSLSAVSQKELSLYDVLIETYRGRPRTTASLRSCQIENPPDDL